MTFLKNISIDRLTDKELVTAFKESGEISHVSTLYQRYMELVFGVCLKYFKEAERSKDAVMDIFEEINRKLKEHEVDNFKGWLHVLARNYCLMQLRSPKNTPTTALNTDFMQSAQITHLSNDVMEREETFDRLARCIESLPEDQQQSIRLFFEQKKCYNEIAEITGYEWNKVRSYIQNGKRNLKICMEETEN
ncbi:MAG: sigma-70 family RNA polymerase sigma factor [Ferruginibacter sp.]